MRAVIMHRAAQRRCLQSASLRVFSSSFSSSAPSSASASSSLPVIHVLRLDHLRLPIASQLRIEEALLRGSASKDTNYCVINQPPTHEKTIVMGISNKTELLVHLDEAERDGVEIVRRFSGGGTVFIDHNCWMSTLIINKTDDDADAVEDGAAPKAPQLYTAPSSDREVPPVGVVHPTSLVCFPNRLMDWTRDFYAPIFNPSFVDAAAASAAAASSPNAVLPFSLTGSDYCFASRKFGGNAQTITKRRWLHHTSFLWTLDSLPAITRYLQNPAKQPEYRQGRAHADFLVSLSEVWNTVEQHAANGDHRTQAQQINAPSDADLFRVEPPAVGAVLPTSLHIPSGLPSRFLWRLSHFFQLHYPSLDEINALVKQYDAESTSAIKRLDYNAERERIRSAEEAAAAKLAAAAGAIGSATS